MPAMSPVNQAVDGVLANAGGMNNLSTNIDTLCQQTTGKTATSGVASKPILKLAQTAVQSIATSAITMIPWSAKLIDTDGMFPTLGADLFTIKTAGWYDISLQVSWASGAASTRSAYIFVNGTVNPANLAAQKDEYMGAASQIWLQCHLYDHFTVGTTIRGACLQTTGGPLSTATDHGGLWMSCVYDAPY